jgi:hypothetical protein
MTYVQLLRKAQKLMGLPDLPHIAFVHLEMSRNKTPCLDPLEETTISFEFALCEYGPGMAFQVLARHALRTEAQPEVWQCLARAAASIDLDERQTELLRRGLKREMPEPPNRVYPHLNFEQLLRLALREMGLPKIPYEGRMRLQNYPPHNTRDAVAWKFEDFWQSPAINGAWNVLAEYATEIDASPRSWEYLAEAAKFLTLTVDQQDMLRRGLVGIDAPQWK